MSTRSSAENEGAARAYARTNGNASYGGTAFSGRAAGASGEITVLLALVSVLTFALFLTALEGGRTACIRALFHRAADAAGDSVLAAYDSALLEQYGLLACSAEEWTERAEHILRKYLEPAKGLLFSGTDRVSLLSLEVQEENSLRLTDDHGAVFGDAVLAYMQSAGLSVLLRELLSRLRLTDEDGAETFAGTLNSFLTEESFSLTDILLDFDELKTQAASLQAAAVGQGDDGSAVPGDGGGDAPAENGSGGQEGADASDFMDSFRRMASYGLTALVTGAAELSALEWETEKLPSALPAGLRDRNAGQGSADLSPDEKFLIGEYALRYCSCYTNPAKDGHLYEMEYILTGADTEAGALGGTVGRLVLIRTGLNFAYLLTDSDKQLEAEAAGEVLAAALAAPPLAGAFKWLLLTAWAAAEGVLDVRHLLNGEKQALWKTEADWRLQALSLGESPAEEGILALSYEDYLRLLFYLGSGEKELYRMMDVMETRLKSTEPSFRMASQMTSAAFSAEASFEFLYVKTPVIGRAAGGKGFCLSEKRRCSYDR